MHNPIQFRSLLNEPKPNYERIWNLQRSLLEKISRGEAAETILLCEHEPVITIGRRSAEGNILKTDLPSFEIERGGDVTYHGPGQLVVYPLIRLRGANFRGGLNEYLRMLEEVLIQVLTQKFDLDAGRYGPTGVWIRNSKVGGGGGTKKIASIGIAVRKWITYHGLALNVSTPLTDFERIRPCNFEPSIMTSLHQEKPHLSAELTVQEMARKIQQAFYAQLVLNEGGGAELSAPATGEAKSLGGGTISFKTLANF